MVDRLQDIGLHARYIPSAQWCNSAVVNRGLEQIETRFVAITDDDCFVAADWLEVMAARLRRDPGAIITGRVELAGDGEVPFSTVLSTEPRTYTKPQLKVHPFVGVRPLRVPPRSLGSAACRVSVRLDTLMED